MKSLQIRDDAAQVLYHPLEKIYTQLVAQEIIVIVTRSKIELIDKKQVLAPLQLSFCDHKTHCITQACTKQPLLKAINISQDQKASIVDLTAGFGRDSLMLSTLDKPLLSIEKSPITAAILKVLVAQYQTIHPCNWQVITDCSLSWLKTQNKHFSHCYLDPFFNKRKSALPKNSMQWLHKLGGDDSTNHTETLFTTAYQYTTVRVVVKRDKNAYYLNQMKPNQGSIYQKTSRFDCYKPPQPST